VLFLSKSNIPPGVATGCILCVMAAMERRCITVRMECVSVLTFCCFFFLSSQIGRNLEKHAMLRL